MTCQFVKDIFNHFVDLIGGGIKQTMVDFVIQGLLVCFLQRNEY